MTDTTAFLTVGTTRFDKLVNRVLDERIIDILKEKGFNKLVMQIGKSVIDFIPTSSDIFQIEYYQYKTSIAEDIRASSLVISHGGAGCLIESLSANKPVIAVINDELMNNHQSELAHQLAEEGCLLYSNCIDLPDAIKAMDSKSLTKYEPGEPVKFWNYLDSNIFAKN